MLLEYVSRMNALPTLALRAHCGKAYEGRIIDPQPADTAFARQRLVMHVRGRGDARPGGTAMRMEFPADSFTAALLPASRTNVWTVEVTPTQFIYQLTRTGSDRRFRVEFDLTRPVPAPPAPWGFEGR